ncbi:MAG: hypothetical protein IJ538_00070 [Clostridia bacterium]|nr:hypothetical protein [Clostridia bacterium]
MIYEEYMDITNFSEFTDENLEQLLNDLEKENNEIVDEWAKEVKTLYDEGLDPYSFWGEKKLKKVTKKYSKHSAAISVIMEDVENEISKREQFHEEQVGLGKEKRKINNISRDEFIKKEQDKTQKHKIYLDVDDEN